MKKESTERMTEWKKERQVIFLSGWRREKQEMTELKKETREMTEWKKETREMTDEEYLTEKGMEMEKEITWRTTKRKKKKAGKETEVEKEENVEDDRDKEGGNTERTQEMKKDRTRKIQGGRRREKR